MSYSSDHRRKVVDGKRFLPPDRAGGSAVSGTIIIDIYSFHWTLLVHSFSRTACMEA